MDDNIMEAKVLSWVDEQWVTVYTITTTPELKVTDRDGLPLTVTELDEWVESQPAQVVKGKRVEAKEDIEGWLEAYSKRSFTYARVELSK